MYLGRIVEVGPAYEVWSNPLHPYTQALLSAVPTTKAAHRRTRQHLEGDLPSPLDPPSGCRFRTRCPKATSLCAAEAPPMRRYAPGHLAACHHINPPETH
jgi:oligopeptide/dipeptide ABC transporter ATP-binding protein